MYNLLCRRPQTSVAPFFLDRGGQQFASVVFWRVLLILKIGQVKNCSCVFFARGVAGQGAGGRRTGAEQVRSGISSV